MVASQPFSSFEIVLQCSSTENGWVSFVTNHFSPPHLHRFSYSSSSCCCYFNATVADSFFTRQILCKAITFTVFFFISSHHIFSSLFGSAVGVAFVFVLVVRVREFDFVSSKKMQNNEDVSEKNCECRKSAIERHINTNWRSLLFSASRNITLATKRNSLSSTHTPTLG